MLRRLILLALALAVAQPAAAVTKVLVTVVDKKTGQPLTGLKADDFVVSIDKKTRRAVEACEFQTGIIDVMMLVDSSMIGQMVSSIAPDMIGQLAEKEQMAIVSYHSSADLIQEFTSSKDLLRQSLSRVEFGNSPRLLDAVYAAAQSGFEGTAFRRVILLLTTGVDGQGRVGLKETVRVARRNGVSVFPVFVMGYGRAQLEDLARLTGGAAFDLRAMAKPGNPPPPQRIFEVMRGHYVITLQGNLPLGDDLNIEVKNQKKLLISYLELN